MRPFEVTTSGATPASHRPAAPAGARWRPGPYLASELDRRTAVSAVKTARAIAAAPAMRGLVKREVKPGPEARSDAALLEFCRDHGATIFHPSGTCNMGSDAMAVLDARLRVRGVADWPALIAFRP